MIDYPGKIACIVFTAGCNFRCGFCHNPELVDPKIIRENAPSFIHPDTFFSFLEKRQGLLDGVVVSGGEPTLQPRLEQFVSEIKTRGFLVKLDTNGSRPEIVRTLFDKELIDYIAMDFKTDEMGYTDLMGLTVRYEKVAESVELIKQSSIPSEFRVTLVRELHSPETLARMAKSLAGADTLYLQQFRPEITLDPVFASYTPFSIEEMSDMVPLFQKDITNVSIRL